MTPDVGERRALRDAALRRLLQLSESGPLAAEQVELAQIDGDPPAAVILPTELVVRESHEHGSIYASYTFHIRFGLSVVRMTRWIRAALVVTTMAAATLVVTAAPAAAGRVEYCFGYRGVFKDDADVEFAPYEDGPGDDKCFGIAPDRTIWNAYRNSNGWQQLPNNGRADYVCTNPGRFRVATGNPVVVVAVNGKGTYTSDYNRSTRKWMAWRHEPGLECFIAIPG